jgi:hypothetical protein
MRSPLSFLDCSMPRYWRRCGVLAALAIDSECGLSFAALPIRMRIGKVIDQCPRVLDQHPLESNPLAFHFENDVTRTPLWRNDDDVHGM